MSSFEWQIAIYVVFVISVAMAIAGALKLLRDDLDVLGDEDFVIDFCAGKPYKKEM